VRRGGFSAEAEKPLITRWDERFKGWNESGSGTANLSPCSRQFGLALLDQQERGKRLYDDFTAIAEAGVDETDVEFAIAAQTQATTAS